MFLSRIQLYLFVGIAFVLGILGIYASGVQRGIDKQRGQLDRARLKKIGQAKEIEDEVNADPNIADRARRWVRQDD
jgi:preprotein translocase subunit SecF